MRPKIATHNQKQVVWMHLPNMKNRPASMASTPLLFVHDVVAREGLPPPTQICICRMNAGLTRLSHSNHRGRWPRSFSLGGELRVIQTGPLVTMTAKMRLVQHIPENFYRRIGDSVIVQIALAFLALKLDLVSAGRAFGIDAIEYSHGANFLVFVHPLGMKLPSLTFQVPFRSVLPEASPAAIMASIAK